jgi:hypothetical protein
MSKREILLGLCNSLITCYPNAEDLLFGVDNKRQYVIAGVDRNDSPWKYALSQNHCCVAV